MQEVMHIGNLSSLNRLLSQAPTHAMLKQSVLQPAFKDAEIESFYQLHEARKTMPQVKCTAWIVAGLSVLWGPLMMMTFVNDSNQSPYPQDIVGIGAVSVLTLAILLLVHCAPRQLLEDFMLWRSWIGFAASFGALLAWSLPVFFIAVFDAGSSGNEASLKSLTPVNCTAPDPASTLIEEFVAGTWVSAAFMAYFSLLAATLLAPLQCALLMLFGTPVYILRHVVLLQHARATQWPWFSVVRIFMHLWPSLMCAMYASIVHSHSRRESYLMLLVLRAVKDKRIRALELRVAESQDTQRASPVRFLEQYARAGEDSPRRANAAAGSAGPACGSELHAEAHGNKSYRSKRGCRNVDAPDLALQSQSDAQSSGTLPGADGAAIPLACHCCEGAVAVPGHSPVIAVPVGTVTGAGRVAVPRLTSHPSIMRSNGTAAQTALRIAGMSRSERQALSECSQPPVGSPEPSA